VGSYISHIEQEQCPVIHASVFEARRAERDRMRKVLAEKAGRSTIMGSVSVGAPLKTTATDVALITRTSAINVSQTIKAQNNPALATTAVANTAALPAKAPVNPAPFTTAWAGLPPQPSKAPNKFVIPTPTYGTAGTVSVPGHIKESDEGPLVFDESPQVTSWDEWDEPTEPSTASLDLLEDFPPLSVQESQSGGGSKVPDLLTGSPTKLKLTKENVAWIVEKELFDAPKPMAPPPKKEMAAMTINTVSKKEEYHAFDPDNPVFNFEQFYNQFTKKYRCPWKGCK
jgi:hypothetical protein